MITKRSAATRGLVQEDWITSYRTFSFPGYFNPNYMNFSDLIAINDDYVKPDFHVPWHKHENTEIFGYVVDGECTHIDSFNNNFILPAGTVQRMSAGAGLFHIEGNSSESTNRYLQIWIKPNIVNSAPKYDNCFISKQEKLNNFYNITNKLPINQDTYFYTGIFTEKYTFNLNTSRKYYLYIVKGTSLINDIDCIEGDGLAFTNENQIVIDSKETEIILFDLK